MPRNSIGFLAIVWLCASVPVCAAERLSLEELNPEALRREEKTVLRTELALNLARKDYYPDHTLSAGYYHTGAMPSMYMARGDFKLPAWLNRLGLTTRFRDGSRYGRGR